MLALFVAAAIAPAISAAQDKAGRYRVVLQVSDNDPDFSVLIAITSGGPPEAEERVYDAGEQACRNLILRFRSG